MGFREVATIGSIDSYLGKKADQKCYHSVSDKMETIYIQIEVPYNIEIRPCYLVSHNYLRIPDAGWKQKIPPISWPLGE